MVSYANKMQRPNGEWFFTHVYPTMMQVSMCGKDPIFKVNVRLPHSHEEPTHWAWRDTGEEDFCMIWPSEVQFKMCFTYGDDAAEKAGQGQRARVVVEEDK